MSEDQAIQALTIDMKAVKEKNIESSITRESSIISWDVFLKSICIIPLSDVRICPDNLLSYFVDSWPGYSSSASLVRHTTTRASMFRRRCSDTASLNYRVDVRIRFSSLCIPYKKTR